MSKSKDIATLNNKMDYSYFNTSLSVSELFFVFEKLDFEIYYVVKVLFHLQSYSYLKDGYQIAVFVKFLLQDIMIV
ncbi:hypothetical protein Y011_21180 [Vibrio parahaemolyticus VP49]|nr:hypothetical protein Y011_21180 [Vibrio parahaemolyticus VP49]